MKLKLVSKGAQAQNIDEHIQVSDATFAREYNESLVHQVVVAYMAAGRAGGCRLGNPVNIPSAQTECQG